MSTLSPSHKAVKACKVIISCTNYTKLKNLITAHINDNLESIKIYNLIEIELQKLIDYSTYKECTQPSLIELINKIITYMDNYNSFFRDNRTNDFQKNLGDLGKIKCSKKVATISTKFKEYLLDKSIITINENIFVLYNSNNDKQNFLKVRIVSYNYKRNTFNFNHHKTLKKMFSMTDLSLVTDDIYNSLLGKIPNKILDEISIITECQNKSQSTLSHQPSIVSLPPHKSTEGKSLDIITHDIADLSITGNLKQKYEENSFNKQGQYIGHKLIIDEKISREIAFYKYFMYGNLEYTHETKRLGKGSYGFVVKYKTNDNPPKYIAVKYGSIDNDIRVINHMNVNSDKCSKLLVEYIIYTNNDEQPLLRKNYHEDGTFSYDNDGTRKDTSCIIMENAIGTIEDLIHVTKNNKNKLKRILYAIVIAIKCLFDIGLYYIDIKLENILYQYTETGYKIILGDLGGAVLKDNEGSLTYPPYECVKRELKWKIITEPTNLDITVTTNLDIKEYIILWGLGILTLFLLGVEHDDILPINNRHYETMEKIISSKDKPADVINYIYDQVTIIIKKIKDTIDPNIDLNIQYIIRNTLCNYTSRVTLDIILNKLHELVYKNKYLKYKYKYLKEKNRLSS